MFLKGGTQGVRLSLSGVSFTRGLLYYDIVNGVWLDLKGVFSIEGLGVSPLGFL